MQGGPGQSQQAVQELWDQRNAGKGPVLVVLNVGMGFMATVEKKQITRGCPEPL